MKTAHRTASQHKRKWQADPGSIYRLMNRIQPFTEPEQTQLNIPPRSAYESLRTGRGTEEDFHTLAVVVNVVLIRSEKIDPLMEQSAQAACAAMMRTWARHKSSGRWGFDGPALQDIPPVIELHEQLIALSTPQQMMEAMREAIRRMDAGEVMQ